MNAVLVPEIEFLPMQPGDFDAVMAIENELYAFPWTRGNFADALKAGYSGWICRRDRDVVGYAVTMLALDEAHLLNISVAAAWQGRGFGARLLRHAMDTARRAGGLSLLLEVRPSNGKAIELYRHFGFAQIGRRRGYYPAEGGREDALVLQCLLDEVSA